MESQTTAQALRPPDLLLRFHAGAPTLQRRTTTRARGFENEVGAGYPANLNPLCKTRLAAYTLSDAPAVDADETDFSTTADAARLFEVPGRRDLRGALL